MSFDWTKTLVVAMVLLPALSFFGLGICGWFGISLSERTISRTVAWALTLATLSGSVLAGVMVFTGTEAFIVPLGSWFSVGHYHFEWTLVADRLSVPFALFASLLTGLVGAFSRRYLHLEAGYARFYLLLIFFTAGFELVVLAGNLDLAFIGWEIVGLTSALLIAFFHERPKPVEHGLRAFLTYRVCDVGLLAAAVWLHHTVGSSTVIAGDGAAPWTGFHVPARTGEATLIGLFLLWASMGKSAQVPLGGWLPRAMEGPTPSSAIFYGAISIHLGPYLLLRAAPILEAAPVAAAAVAVLGGLTALHGTIVGRVQSDIKSALAYASMTQVGLIFVEIGLGFRTLALVHIVGHATIRSLEILRSPSLLHDHHHLEQAMGSQLPRAGGHFERWVPKRWQPWLYRMALERGYFDGLLRDYVVRPFVRLLRRGDADAVSHSKAPGEIAEAAVSSPGPKGGSSC